jgi:hypothetical protein
VRHASQERPQPAQDCPLLPAAVWRHARRARGWSARRPRPRTPPMFLFFSNRLGCFGSLAVSLVVTVVLLLALGVIRTH